MGDNTRKKNFRICNHRVDLIIPGADGEKKVMIYANSLESAMLIQSWIFKMLDLRQYRTVRYNLVEMDYLMDPRSVHEVCPNENHYAKFSRFRQNKASGRIDVCIHRDAVNGGDVNLTFYPNTRDDLSVFAMYLKNGLAGTNHEIKSYVRRGGNWEPWVESLFLRKDRAEVLYGLTPENAERVIEFAKRIHAGEDLEIVPANVAKQISENEAAKAEATE